MTANPAQLQILGFEYRLRETLRSAPNGFLIKKFKGLNTTNVKRLDGESREDCRLQSAPKPKLFQLSVATWKIPIRFLSTD